MSRLMKLFGVLGAAALAAALAVTAAAQPGPTASPGPARPETEARVNQRCIDWCTERGLMVGDGSDLNATAPATRAMAASVLYRLDGGTREFSESAFQDVADGAWYCHAVGWAHKRGLMLGTGGERFSPERNITRQELAAILYRREGSPEDWSAVWPTDVEELEDWDQVSPYAREAARWAMDAELIPYYYYSDGVHHSYFLPQGTVSRSELAEVLYVLDLRDPEPLQIDPAQVDAILLRQGEGASGPDEEITEPEQIERFVSILNGFQVGSSQTFSTPIGCGDSITLCFKERDPLRLEYSGNGMLKYSGFAYYGVTALYSASPPEPFPDDEFAVLIYGRPEEAGE